MFRYALTSLRANLTRLVATALAVVIGITFLASGLMLTDAMRSGLTGDVEAAVRRGRPGCAADRGQRLRWPRDGALPPCLATVRATPGVDGVRARRDPVERPTALRPDGTTANLRSQGRSWITDDELNPMTLDEGAAPRPRRRGRARPQARGRGGGWRRRHRRSWRPPSAGPRPRWWASRSFGDQDSLDDGGTIWFDEAPRSSC